MLLGPRHCQIRSPACFMHETRLEWNNYGIWVIKYFNDRQDSRYEFYYLQTVINRQNCIAIFATQFFIWRTNNDFCIGNCDAIPLNLCPDILRTNTDDTNWIIIHYQWSNIIIWLSAPETYKWLPLCWNWENIKTCNNSADCCVDFVYQSINPNGRAEATPRDITNNELGNAVVRLR